MVILVEVAAVTVDFTAPKYTALPESVGEKLLPVMVTVAPILANRGDTLVIAGQLEMMRSAKLSVEMRAGDVEITRIRYFFPEATPVAGITAAIFTGPVAIDEPIFTVLVKLPVESESWAVNILPKLNVMPVLILTFNDAPVHNWPAKLAMLNDAILLG